MEDAIHGKKKKPEEALQGVLEGGSEKGVVLTGAPETRTGYSAIVANDFQLGRVFRWRRFLRIHSAFSTVQAPSLSLSFLFIFLNYKYILFCSFLEMFN